MIINLKGIVLGRVVFVLSFIINIVFALQVMAGLNGYHLDYFFCSDALYLPSIYRDLFIDKALLSGWYLNLAPNFIPEWPIYFGIEYLTSNFRLTHVIYAVLSVFLITVLATGIFRKVLGKRDTDLLSLFNIGFSIFLLIYLVDGDFVSTSLILLTGFHAGAFILSLLSYYLFISYLKSGNRLFPSLLAITVYAGVLSDILLLSLFVLPFMSTILFMRDKKYGKMIVQCIIIVVTSSIMGYLTLHFSLKAGIFSIDNSMGRIANFEGILPSLRIYTDTLIKVFLSGGFHTAMIIISSAGLIIGLLVVLKYLFNKSKYTDTDTLVKILILLLISTIIMVAISPILNGNFKHFSHLRYNYFSFYFATYLFGFLLILFAGYRYWLKKSLRIFCFLITFILLGIAINIELSNSTPQGLKRTIHYYPEKVALIDSLATQNNLKYGVGSYWNSKYTTMFSKSGVRIYCVSRLFGPWYHVANRNWYLQGGGAGRHSNPTFNFILLEDYTLYEKTIDFFGGEIDTISLSYINIGLVKNFQFRENRNAYLVKGSEKSR